MLVAETATFSVFDRYRNTYIGSSPKPGIPFEVPDIVQHPYKKGPERDPKVNPSFPGDTGPVGYVTFSYRGQLGFLH